MTGPLFVPTQRDVWYFPATGIAVVCMGIYLHVTRLFLDAETLIARIYTPAFDLTVFIPMLFTAIFMPIFYDRVKSRAGWRNALYWVMVVYFWLSVPIHLRAQIRSILRLCRRRHRTDAGDGGMFAFLFESAFVGALLWGEQRLGPRMHFIAAVSVATGSWLSAYFILVTNAFMQHPVGYSVSADGTLAIADLRAYLFNEWALVQFAHNQVAALVTGRS